MKPLEAASCHERVQHGARPCVADVVAQLVRDMFESLSKVGKPVIRSNGIPEWTILAGIVVERQGEQPYFTYCDPN
jgi:hypothetical protein